MAYLERFIEIFNGEDGNEEMLVTILDLNSVESFTSLSDSRTKVRTKSGAELLLLIQPVLFGQMLWEESDEYGRLITSYTDN